ncbi:MAG: metal ABC transporter solute-binding protein, Zn/Mn family, partial [Actinomycetota bacterium]
MVGILFVSAALAACGGDDSSTPTGASSDAVSCSGGTVVDGRPIQIASTVAPITNIVANIAADTDAVIKGLVPEGTNSHTFEPPPSAAKTLEEADVVFINGLVLEEPTKDLA